MDFDALFSGLDRHTLDGITRGSIYALVALGYTMVYGVMKLINFAHSEVFMVGTWAVLGVYTVLGVTAGAGLGVVIGATLLALIAAMLASAGTALAVERIAYRPLRKKGAPPLIFLITGIGCSMVLVETFGQVFRVFFGPPFGRVTVNIPSVLQTKELFTIPGVDLTGMQENWWRAWSVASRSSSSPGGRTRTRGTRSARRRSCCAPPGSRRWRIALASTITRSTSRWRPRAS